MNRIAAAVAVATLSATIPGTNALGSGWVQSNSFPVPSGASYFGASVALDGDTCVIAAPAADPNTGSVYVYTQDAAGSWSVGAALAVPSGASDFGWRVALDGDTCVIGAPKTDSLTGSAYVYTRDAAGSWSAGTALTVPSGASYFGASVALDGDTCVIGVPDFGGNGTGNAYVYTRDAAGSWSTGTALTVPSGVNDFGASVALDGDTCVIGAYETKSNTGSAYVYTQDAAGSWSAGTALTVPSGASDFGASVALDGDTCVITATDTDSNTGSAYVYTQDAAGSWSAGTGLAVPSGASVFGRSVALDGDTCVIGATGTDSPAGSAYVYTQDAAGSWSAGTGLTVPSGVKDFGASVALDGDTCVIGADETNSNTGSAYAYQSTTLAIGNLESTVSSLESQLADLQSTVASLQNSVSQLEQVVTACCASNSCSSDVDNDGDIDIQDLLQVISDWGFCD